MKIFRSVFFYIILCLSTIVLGTIAIAGSFITRHWPNRLAWLWGGINLWAAGAKVRVSGLENIDSTGPYIFVSNHQGWFDIFAALNKIPIYFSWLAKEELFKIPILGRAMHSAGYISIDRSDHRKALVSMHKAAEIIRQGTSVFIFPEGTRSPDGILREFKKGGFVLAAKSRQPVVPVSISGSYKILPKSSWLIHPGEIRFTISAPIFCEGADSKSRDVLLEKVREKIRSNLAAEEAGSDIPEAGADDIRNGSASSRNV
ncbi:MAG: 1-acyl-sn-glycerol-3-phosphate acyltransferase [Desulfobacteraceae bacterium]|nr:1-acyl-sn-glycerol-3-phosphate acyltransferase [Desulfobacteraceae bacterium]